MKWINVKYKHFVDIAFTNTGKQKMYSWIENNNCPSGEFLVGLFTNESFEWFKVVLTENGLNEVCDDDNQPLPWCITDVEYWMEIEMPKP
jgi:hypothetical protein